MSEEIARIAARGDGVTKNGVHVRGALPGDRIADGVIVEKGPHHVAPACKHFGRCGGCQLQHADEQTLAQFVRDRVFNAAEGQGLKAEVELPVHLSPPQSRRRATLHGLRTAKGAVLGYREGGSHKIVDLEECPVIIPDLARQIAPLRAFLAEHGPRGPVDLQLALCDQGVDLGLANFPLDGLGPTEAVLDLAQASRLARVAIDQGFGPEAVWEPEPATITLSGVPVPFPPGSFLQATRDAEMRMIADAGEWLAESDTIADLFAGLGTFAFALADGKRVLAVEAEQAAHHACKAAAPRAAGKLVPMHRDLFRSPLQPDELNRFDAVLLDPPRAGAKSQIAEIARSDLSRVVYISCNPSSWARDAARLTESGFGLAKLRPVGQFRWSTHVELTSLFVRT